MKIIAIDPGFDRMGLAIIEKQTDQNSSDYKKEKLIFSDCFITNKKNTNHKRILEISNYIIDILKKYEPKVLIIESIFLFKNQKTIIDVAGARAVIINECLKNNLEIFELTPMQIKSAITSDGHADKKQVEFMINNILKNDTYFQDKKQKYFIEKKKILDDEIDAIACSLAGLAYFVKI